MRLAEERREPIESLDCDMPTPKPAAHRGIDGGVNPENMQEAGDLADHPMPMVGRAAGPAFTKILRVGQDGDPEARPLKRFDRAGRRHTSRGAWRPGGWG